MGYVTRWLATVCFAVALAVPGHAQLTGYYPFGTDSLSLSNDDFMRLIDAANGLLQRSPLPIGATANWQNNQTGSSGTIRVTKTFLHGSMRCHRLVYETTPAGTPPANLYVPRLVQYRPGRMEDSAVIKEVDFDQRHRIVTLCRRG